ncbi:MAG: PIN domain-containing protein [Gemmatimonadota bacterium]|nr:PIN domain-containing protein [Gemmatimonadota bacterium]
MSSAYVDTSCIVAAAFGEATAVRVTKRLARFDRVLSSPLLEAELLSALMREGRPPTDAYSSAIELVIVNRPLSTEIGRVLEAGYLRGADCWHLATALYVAADARGLTFVTLDSQQRKVATALGFKT